MDKYAIIVAGGKGLRMCGELPKQFMPIGGKPVLMHTINAFYTYDPGIHIILVLPESQLNFWTDLCKEHSFTLAHNVTAGGNTRFESVKNGLDMIKTSGIVAVHDGVRPFVKKEIISNCFDVAAQYGSAVPVVELVDSIRKVENDANYAVNRADYRLVQTPQVFNISLLKEAYEKAKNETNTEFTDDASVFTFAGHDIKLVEGNRENIKLTTPFDLSLAEVILKQPE